ncbi:hypothetical protein [Marmoricola sp. RAF53]|uniref:hypothetical protein n=1 Tax=Marmoricola sp. RAF53 TaxID=3233059 RepID=UPI003F9EA4AB
MPSNETDRPPPRHRRPGRAVKRGTGLPGRHLPTEPITSRDCSCPPGFHEYGAHAPGHRSAGDEAPPPPGAYPVEDLAAMSPGAAELLLHRATQEAEAEVATYPHIVITRDIGTGEITYSGPFPNGLEALTMAHRFVHQNRFVDPRWSFTLTVAPLFPH